MHYTTAAITVSSLLAVVSGTPFVARGNTCGSVPTASNTAVQPLEQPTGIQTAAACQAKCDAESACLSFVFGMVDNEIQCKLFDVAGSAVPKQSSTNLIVYDKACSSVPSAVPSSSNPTGKADKKASKQARDVCGSKPTASTNNKPTKSPKASSADACKDLCKADTSCKR